MEETVVKTSKLLFFILLLVLPFGQALSWPYPYYIIITPGITTDGRMNVVAYKDGIVSEDPPQMSGAVYAGGSYFAMPSYLGTSLLLLSPNVNGGYIDLFDYQSFVPNPDEPHPDLGGGGYSPTLTAESNILRPFTFFGIPTYVGINPVSYQSGNPHSAPLLDIDVSSCTAPPDAKPYCNITADLSAWEVFWNGSVFEQGPRPDNTEPFVLATGVMYVGGHIVLEWVSQIRGGAFDGVIAVWHIEGDLAIFAPSPATP